MADFDIDQLLEQSLQGHKKSESAPKRASSRSPDRSDNKRRREDSKDSSRRDSRESDRRDSDRTDRHDRERDYGRRDSYSDRDRDRDYRRHDRDRDYRRSSYDRRRDDRDERRPAAGSVAAFVPVREKERPMTLEEVGDRDARTVFAYNLPTKAGEREITKFFERAGKVRDVRLITDRNSRKSKGFGYIEMDTMTAVSEAIQLSGTQFMGKVVQIQASQSEKNGIATAAQAQGPTRLLVAGLHANITEQDIKAIFLVFGDVDFVHLHREPETGVSKGFAFVQFKNGDAAKRALVQVNGQELAGRPLKVGLVSESGNKESNAAFAEEDGEGAVALDPVSRSILMSKLGARPGEEREKQGPTTSNCISLKNMFQPNDPEMLTNPNFEQELEDDVREECAKYGIILHVYVDRFSTDGSVYMRFEKVDSATRAYSDLNGRWFAGLQVAVSYIPEGEYLRKFPAAR